MIAGVLISTGLGAPAQHLFFRHLWICHRTLLIKSIEDVHRRVQRIVLKAAAANKFGGARTSPGINQQYLDIRMLGSELHVSVLVLVMREWIHDRSPRAILQHLANLNLCWQLT